MLAYLILAVTFGLGIASGYGVRDLISRIAAIVTGVAECHPARHRSRKPRRRAISPSISTDLLVAANDDVAGGRRRQQREQGVERSEQPDDFDGAVRDLLSELNRRSSQPPEPALRGRR